MSERHTVDFDRVSINVISDAERGTITLQFDNAFGGLSQNNRILQAIDRRYGVGMLSRLRRWIAGLGDPPVLALRSGPHPENPDVSCLVLRVKRPVGMESALVSLMEFLRRQPGYQRMFGSPLDRDEMPSRVRRASSVDSSEAANDALRRMMERRRQPSSRRSKN
jgi:hypothetical protein